MIRSRENTGSEAPHVAAAHDTISWRWLAFAICALVIGAALRLSWGEDIEFKYDESYMFQRAMRAGVSEALPQVGMSSGAGVVNPGVSVWLFVAGARAFGIRTPPQLARVVQLSNVVALTLAMLIAYRMNTGANRKVWIWAIGLACVNPFAVLFARKIWAQSLLPLFCVVLIMGWWRRHTRWGAFVWGLIGTLLGQIHLSGFFLSASLFLWTLRDYTRRRPYAPVPTVPWLSFAAGATIGVVPLLPWLGHLLVEGGALRDHDFVAVLFAYNMFGLWYLILWASGALGLGMTYSLGTREFLAFLSYPHVAGSPTYVMAVAHSILFGLGVWLLIKRAWPSSSQPIDVQRALWGGAEPADRLISAALVGCGLLLALTGVPIYRHYLIVTFPLQWLWLARQARLATRHWSVALGIMWACELAIAAGFLYYIHVNHGAITGDYGPTYSRSR